MEAKEQDDLVTMGHVCNETDLAGIDIDVEPSFSKWAGMTHYVHDDSCVDPRGILQCAHSVRPPDDLAPRARFRLSRHVSWGGPTFWDKKDGREDEGEDALGMSGMTFGRCDDECASQMSCTSTCRVSCPSRCGETSQGMYCDDDACADGPCLDAACDDACQPCTDADCDTTEFAHPAPAPSALMSDGDKQAAAALASFGDVGLSQFSQFAGDGMHDWTHADNFLASHILEFHNPVRMRPCAVDHRDFPLSRCTLPKALTGVDLSGETFTHHLSGHPCGYPVDDVDQFAYHLFADHLPLQVDDGAAALVFKPAHDMAFLPPAPLAFQPAPAESPSTPSVPTWSMESSTCASPSTHISSMASLERLSVEPADGKREHVCRWRVGGGSAICGRRFGGADELHAHGKTEHIGQQCRDADGFRCLWGDCARSSAFTQRSKLDRHLQTHTGYKPVQCEICGEQLSAKQALIQHMRTHTGEEPWKCRHPGCSRTFKQQSALTMHERTHSGERPLECNICGKTFGESSNLSKHRRTHNDRGNFVCTVCHKDFNRHDQLRRHAMRKHQVTHPEEVEMMISRPMKVKRMVTNEIERFTS